MGNDGIQPEVDFISFTSLVHTAYTCTFCTLCISLLIFVNHSDILKFDITNESVNQYSLKFQFLSAIFSNVDLVKRLFDTNIRS